MNHAIARPVRVYNSSTPLRVFVVAPTERTAALASQVLTDAGYLAASQTFDRPTNVAELVAMVTEDVATLRLADVLVTLPGTTKHAYVDEAAAYGIPVVTLAWLVGAL